MSDEKKSGVSISVPGEAIDKAVADVISAVVGEASNGVIQSAGTIFGGLIGDRLKEWRTRNFLSTCQKTADLMRKSGVDPKAARALPNAEIYALFGGMSEAEEPSIRDMWAALLARRLNPSFMDGLNLELVSSIKLMSGYDATVFDFFLKSIPHQSALAAEIESKIDFDPNEEFAKVARPAIDAEAFIDEFEQQLVDALASPQPIVDYTGAVRKLIRLGLLETDNTINMSSQAHDVMVKNSKIDYRTKAYPEAWTLDDLESQARNVILNLMRRPKTATRWYFVGVKGIKCRLTDLGMQLAETLQDGRE
ncbi:hypothetical protein [Tateyamaria sp. SN3-11]|uniref:Abi-alpha family protein n=1 Tax=Tateyamaria sp. SN3-11 TaxID=3092147 RepID=UPI0039E94850